MRAGSLKYRLRLLKPVYNEDGLGSELVDYQETTTVWAERVTMRGSRTEAVGEHFSDYSTEWRIRDAHTVDDHWRVQEPGGHLYEVTTVIPNRDRGMLTLRCERVNE